jgi:hypothetical protein
MKVTGEKVNVTASVQFSTARSLSNPNDVSTSGLLAALMGGLVLPAPWLGGAAPPSERHQLCTLGYNEMLIGVSPPSPAGLNNDFPPVLGKSYMFPEAFR